VRTASEPWLAAKKSPAGDPAQAVAREIGNHIGAAAGHSLKLKVAPACEASYKIAITPRLMN
jgi:hypothetical protein